MAKKIVLLAVMALVAVVVAIPASASADVWTDNGIQLGEGETANQSFEGFLQLNAGANGTLGCQVTVEIEAEGPSGGRITKFNPTTSTCEGTKVFAGCVVTSDSSNIGGGWNISSASTPLSVTAAGGLNLTLHVHFKSCFSALTTIHIEFGAWFLSVTLSSGLISKLSVSGTSTTGVVISGSLTPESTPTLGLE